MTEELDVSQPRALTPLHSDAVREFSIGTVFFAAATIVLLVGGEQLKTPDWWLQVAVCGLGIGVIATAYCVWRRAKRARDLAQGIPAPTP